VDVYWVRDGGTDPAAFVGKHAARVRILHAKDSYLEERGKRSFAPVGGGVLDFPAIFKALAPSPCPWVVVEQDTPNAGQTAEACVKASRLYLRDKMSL
jgi:sugar phosphate isomerase/epimerase